MRVPRGVRSLAVAAIVVSDFALATAGAQATNVVPERPTPGPAKALAFPAIHVDTLSNGLRVAVVENHSLPVVAVRTGFSGGSFLDAPGKEGSWTLMQAALLEGTTTRSSTAISDMEAEFGTTITSVPALPGPGAPRYLTVKSAWAPMLDLLGDMLANPTFPAEGVARLQGVQAQTAAGTSGTSTAYFALLTRLFGAEHPYPRHATDSSVRRVTRDDLVALHQTYVGPENTVLVVAGDVTPSDVRAAAQKAFGSWPRSGTPIESKLLPPLVQPSRTSIYLRDVPGSAQSFIYSGEVVASRASADGPAIEIINSIFGGGTNSRMFDAFRTKRGLSYAPGVTLLWRGREPQAAVLGQTTQTAWANTDSAVITLAHLLREVVTDRPFTQAEVDFAKRNLVGALPASYGTTPGLATGALDVVLTGLPLTFWRDYPTRIGSVTLADVQATATKYIDPDHVPIIVAGDRTRIEAALRATGIPVIIVP